MNPEATPRDTGHGPSAHERLGEHNVSVDETRRRHGACAQVHLPTGRMCTMRHGHGGSCEFVDPHRVDATLADHRAAEGW